MNIHEPRQNKAERVRISENRARNTYKKHKDDNIHKIKAKKIRRHFHILLYKVVGFLECSEGSR